MKKGPTNVTTRAFGDRHCVPALMYVYCSFDTISKIATIVCMLGTYTELARHIFVKTFKACQRSYLLASPANGSQQHRTRPIIAIGQRYASHVASGLVDGWM